MVKGGSTTFSATKVAKTGLAASAALTRILELEKEVSKLRHHVSVLSKRNHALQKEVEKRGSGDGAEVASPVRVQEPEPQVVAEPEVRMSVTIVAEDEEDVWVAPVAKPAVAESRVVLEVDEPEVVMVRLPKGKRRRTCEGVGSEAEESGAEESEAEVEVVEEVGIIVATLMPREPREPRGMVVVEGAPVGPRGRGFVGRGVVNPKFPMFFNHAQRFAGDHEKWPVRRSRRSR